MTPFTQEERFIIYRQNFGKSYEKLAEICMCHKDTVMKDMKAWKNSGEFEALLLDEWKELHGIVKNEDPIEAYKVLSRMLMKTMREKIDINQNVTVGIEYTKILKKQFGIGLEGKENDGDDPNLGTGIIPESLEKAR